eukprot:snap_masked-scaffold_3-processed-gene-19.20-mRNA-1 protein AED:1.00 eAED:1.00 QI:0/0/0/0/1/1/2/0/325
MKAEIRNLTKCEPPFVSSDEDNHCDITIYEEYSQFTDLLKTGAVSGCLIYLVILIGVIFSFVYTNRKVILGTDKQKKSFFKLNLKCLFLHFIGLFALLVYSYNGFMLKLDPFSRRGKINNFFTTLCFQALCVGSFYLLRIFKDLIGFIELSKKRNKLYTDIFKFLVIFNIIYLGGVVAILIMELVNSVIKNLANIVSKYKKTAYKESSNQIKYEALAKKLRIYKRGGFFQCFVIFPAMTVTLNPTMNTTPEALLLQAVLMSTIPLVHIPLLFLYAKYIYSKSDACFSSSSRASQSNEHVLNILSTIAESIQLDITDHTSNARNSV